MYIYICMINIHIYIYNDLFKITNISLLSRRFINAINVINVLYIYIYIYI